MKVALRTLGCRLNEAELETWAQQFQTAGARIVEAISDADVIVLNTCAVTSDAARKSRNLLRRLKHEHPQARLVLSGCQATLAASDADAATHFVADLVVTNSHKEELVQRTVTHFPELLRATPEAPEPVVNLLGFGRQRAFVKVQDGCRYRCAFCIVTVARGAERSRAIHEIVDEINRLNAESIHEVVLTGVHLGGYGHDRDTTLADLVTAILSGTDTRRLRLGSLEPWDLPSNFFDLFADTRLMPHLHLPMQSGSDSVLRRMARRCKTAEFRELAANARSQVPDINLTTDIIVGFPGETEAEWEETLRFAAELAFGHIHIFPFSARSGTKAASMPDQVPDVIIRERRLQLENLARELKHARLQKALGDIVPVLWESAAPINSDRSAAPVCSGYTPNYLKVLAETGDSPLTNQIKLTRLVSVDPNQPAIWGQPVGR